MPPPADRETKYCQNILDSRTTVVSEFRRAVPTRVVREEDLAESDVFSVFDAVCPLGISPGFSESGQLAAVAITDGKRCRIIEFKVNRRAAFKPNKSSTYTEARTKLQDAIFCRPTSDIFAFDMGPLALSLHSDLGIQISGAVDIQSAFPAVGRKPLEVIKAALGESVLIKEANLQLLFRYYVYDSKNANCISDLFMRSWISAFLPSFGNGQQLFEKAKRIDTGRLTPAHIQLISRISTNSLAKDQKKPVIQTHRVTQKQDASDGGLQLDSAVFSGRLRKNQHIQITAQTSQGPIMVSAETGNVAGRAASVLYDKHHLSGKSVATVTSIGRDEPTLAESKQAAIILQVLQGTDRLLDDSPWIRNIWLASDETELSWPEDWTLPLESRRPHKPPAPSSSQALSKQRPLNSSQQTAVNSMLAEDNKHHIVIIQGPPGTGKTSVISSFVFMATTIFQKGGIYLIAQSNVAVKNIAEKLISIGFWDWRLLLSKDFHFDWHEHLYNPDIQKRIIRSDIFKYTSQSQFQGVQVILCTLSMLSNKDMSKFRRWVPLRTLVVDEASQIEIGNYLPVFHAFKNTLRKICFIGDDRQLPPFGQEDIQDLQSIFEVAHLRKQVIFLDTQYRMPPQIGDIISEAVYEGKLKSNPAHPVTNKTTACYFVAANGKECQIESNSTENFIEAGIVIKLAQKLQEQNKDYKIITPYDAQRNKIETAMQDAGLLWADKCFNVDSFQGNEEDFIIISVVRTREVGFLKNLRRTNVMCSRCKKGMFIVANPQFLAGPGASTLVGTLLQKSGGNWLLEADIENINF